MWSFSHLNSRIKNKIRLDLVVLRKSCKFQNASFKNRTSKFLVEGLLFCLADCGSATFQAVLRGKKHMDVLFSAFEREANRRRPLKTA